jgi:hypothetical protein
MRFFISIIALLFASHILLLAQNNYKWIFIKESDNIEIYYRESDTLKYEEFKFTTSYHSSPEEITAIISNIDRLPQWSYICEETKMIKKYSANEYIYYYNTDTPWPLMDRDAVLHITIARDSKGTITISSKNSPGWEPEYKNKVRIPRLKSQWILKPTGTNKTHIEFYFSTDPGGMIPKWLLNSSISYGPIKTLTTLREILEKNKHSN